MKCEDVILELGPGEVSLAVAAHLAECAECRSAADALALAALPARSGPETVGLSGLARRTERAWHAQEQRRLERTGWWRQTARLALAAGLGALVASGVSSLWTTAPTARGTTPSAVQTVASERLDPEEPAVDEANLSDDEVFFEVSWPTPTEGEL
jgi:hypothetical protein